MLILLPYSGLSLGFSNTAIFYLAISRIYFFPLTIGLGPADFPSPVLCLNPFRRSAIFFGNRDA